MPLEAIENIRHLVQGWFQDNYLGMQVTDNLIVHEVEYTLKRSIIPGMNKVFGIMPIKLDKELSLFQAEFDMNYPPFTQQQIEKKWLLEKDLKDFLKEKKIRLKPKDKFIIRYFASSSSNTIAETPRINFQRINAHEIIEDFEVKLLPPFNHSTKVITGIEIPGNWSKEDAISIEVRQNGIPKEYETRVVQLKDLRISDNTRFPSSGIRGSKVFDGIKPQHQLYIQNIVLDANTKTVVSVRKRI